MLLLILDSQAYASLYRRVHLTTADFEKEWLCERFFLRSFSFFRLWFSLGARESRLRGHIPRLQRGMWRHRLPRRV